MAYIINLCKISRVKFDIGLHAVHLRAGVHDSITKFSRIDSSQHFLSYGEYARARSAREEPRWKNANSRLLSVQLGWQLLGFFGLDGMQLISNNNNVQTRVRIQKSWCGRMQTNLNFLTNETNSRILRIYNNNNSTQYIIIIYVA